MPEGHDPRRDLHDDEIAVLAPQPDLAAARLVPPDNVPVQLFPVLRVFPQADFQAGAAGDLCLAETERALPGFIDLHVLPAGIAGHGKRLGRQRKEAGESLLAFPQSLFRLLADGDVLEGADEAHQLLTFHDRGDVKPGPGNAAVPAVMASLAGKRLALGDGGAPLLLVLAKVLRMQPLRDAPAGQLGLGNAGDLESAPRIVDRLAGGIGYEYAQHRAFADGAEALLGGMQVVFGALQRSDVMALRHQIDHLAGVIADRRKEEVEVVEAAVSAGVVGFEAVMAARGNPADRLLQPLLLLRIMRPPWRLPVGLADHVLELDAGALERRAIDIDHRPVGLQQADHAARGIDNGAIALFVAGASSLGDAAPLRLAQQRRIQPLRLEVQLALRYHQQHHADRQVDDRSVEVGARILRVGRQVGEDEDIAAIQREQKADDAVADTGMLASAPQHGQPGQKEHRSGNQVRQDSRQDAEGRQAGHRPHRGKGQQAAPPGHCERPADEDPRTHGEQHDHRGAEQPLAVGRLRIPGQAEHPEADAAGAGSIGGGPVAQCMLVPVHPPQVQEDSSQHGIADEGTDDSGLDRNAEHGRC